MSSSFSGCCDNCDFLCLSKSQFNTVACLAGTNDSGTFPKRKENLCEKTTIHTCILHGENNHL